MKITRFLKTILMTDFIGGLFIAIKEVLKPKKTGIAINGDPKITNTISSLGQYREPNLIENEANKTNIIEIESTKTIINCFVGRFNIIKLDIKL